MYHYLESGLDNVWLTNGYRFHETPYGKGVSIQNSEGLHKAIAKWIVSQPKPINGAELRFLRLEMDQTQRDLAAFLGSKEQNVRLWERYRKKPMPGSADRLLRVLYNDFIGNDGHVRRMLERLADLNQIEVTEARFSEKKNKWKAQLVPTLDSPGSEPAKACL